MNIVATPKPEAGIAKLQPIARVTGQRLSAHKSEDYSEALPAHLPAEPWTD
jgi:hypothetical protein